MDVFLGAAGRREEEPPSWRMGFTSSHVSTLEFNQSCRPWQLGAALVENRGWEKSIRRETHGTCNQMNRDFK